MKTCKKCKKKVANAAKICKYCGSDVSKIKPVPNKRKNASTNQSINKKTTPKQSSDKKTTNKAPLKKATIKNIELEEKNIETPEETKNIEINKRQERIKEVKEKLKENTQRIYNVIFNNNEEKKEINIVKKKLTSGITCSLDEDLKEVRKRYNSGIPVVVEEEKTKFFDYKKIEIKKIINKITLKIKGFFQSRKEKKNEKKRNRELTKTEEKIPIAIEEPEDEYEGYSIKKIVAFILIVLIIGFGSFYGIKVLKSSNTNSSYLKVTEKKKDFNQYENISFKGMVYKITSIYTSEGTKYRKPKEGNIFVLVNIEYTNDSKETKEYNYKNWLMQDEEGHETSRVFTPINVDTALYSGKLVVGAKKKGSLVFEESKDSKELKVNFYNDKKLKEIEESKEAEKEYNIKPDFSIKIDMSKAKELVIDK